MNMMFDGNKSKGVVNVLIVGDTMLDRYEYGSVRRMSPEAPVPVLLHSTTKTMLGGAGNVAVNVRALDAEPILFSQIGNDAEGRLVKKLLKAAPVKSQLFLMSDAPTIVKTRFISGTNHILRVDREPDPVVPFVPSASFKAKIDKVVKHSDIVLISDYGKGFDSINVCQVVIKSAARHNKVTLVDPKCSDYKKYAGASLVKPNLKEFSQVTGKSFNPKSVDFEKSAVVVAQKLCQECNIGALLITLSEYGMLYVSRDVNVKPIFLPTEAREVYDVSGAGDTTLAALAVALAEGKDMAAAMRFANVAAGVVVAKLGTALATRSEIARSIHGNLPTDKILTRKTLKSEILTLRRAGKCIGFTNGCFDCCHLGHLTSLLEARRLCDVLVVGVNSDKWIRKHKGLNRPIQDEMTRTSLLAALSCVDYVTVFSDETALPLVKLIKPDVIAKEGYAIDKWPEGRYVQSYGGSAVTLNRVDGYSTTALTKKMGNHL